MDFDLRRVFLFYKAGFLKNAKKINISLTNKCNFRCRTCNIWQLYQDFPNLVKQEMQLKDYELFFNNFNYWNWIGFTGGEPFLKEDLVDLISVAYERCKGLHTISIPTNGYLTDKIVCDVREILFMKIPSIYISVSIDGLQEIHDATRGIKRSFEHAISTFNNLRTLKDRRLKVHFEYVVSKNNQGKLSELISALGLNPDDFIVTIAQKSLFYNNMSLDIEPDHDILLNDLNWFSSNLKIHSIHDIAQWTFLKYALKGNHIPCCAGKNSFYLDPYGNIFPCISQSTLLGTIKDNNLKPFEKNPDCICFTPCESYFAILTYFPQSVFSVVIK